jgi:predicted DNA binding CopG/RHH family protein
MKTSPKTVRVTVHMTEELYERVRQRADEEARPISNYIAYILTYDRDVNAGYQDLLRPPIPYGRRPLR